MCMFFYSAKEIHPTSACYYAANICKSHADFVFAGESYDHADCAVMDAHLHRNAKPYPRQQCLCPFWRISKVSIRTCWAHIQLDSLFCYSWLYQVHRFFNSHVNKKLDFCKGLEYFLENAISLPCVHVTSFLIHKNMCQPKIGVSGWKGIAS